MGIVATPETSESKERVKWEAEHSMYGPPQRRYVYRDYPLMMHKAGRPENGMGKDCITETVVVESETQEAAKWHEGFRRHPVEALETYTGQSLEIAKLAANLDWQTKHGLSDKAVAEVHAAQAAHAGHLPSVPVTPIKKRVKKVKES